MTSDDSATPEPPLIASVLPLVPAWRVDRDFDYAVPEALAARIAPGTLVRVPFGGRRVRAIVRRLSRRAPDRDLAEISAVVVEAPLAPPPVDALLEWIARRYASQESLAFARVVPPRVRVAPARLEARPQAPDSDRLRSYDGGDALFDAIQSGVAATWLLQCLPGEDRGALISELVAHVARRGTALVAVPEVRYGSEVLDALERAHAGVARVDSARPESERSAAWLALATGTSIGAGGRATVLAPASDVALVVVDEEHHVAFKEDRAPRFETRRVAVERARLHGAVCVLMSAAPSIETGSAALDGRVAWASPRRDDLRARRPVVEIVDAPRDRALARPLHERVRDALRAGQRVALLAPHRGFARALWCATCKRSLRCPVCEAGLFYDRSTDEGSRVRCARCGFSGPAPDECPACGAAEWRYLGAGSERLTDQVARAFPGARVDRADPDYLVPSPPASPPDVYVTTWIGTKVSLRPDVSLVGVLDADALIRRPHFRAAEHAYQALAEMAEWAGPARDGGRLVVQTSEAGHHVIQAVARADYRYFIERELPHREELAYPPFSELIKVSVDPGADAPVDAITRIARRHGARTLGPIQAGAGRGRRLELLLKCPSAEAVATDLRGILATAPPELHLRVDVDPR